MGSGVRGVMRFVVVNKKNVHATNADADISMPTHATTHKACPAKCASAKIQQPTQCQIPFISTQKIYWSSHLIFKFVLLRPAGVEKSTTVENCNYV